MIVGHIEGDDACREERSFEVRSIRIALPESALSRIGGQYSEGRARDTEIARKTLFIREKPGIESFLKPADVWSMSGLRQRFEHHVRFTCHSRPARQSGDGMDRPIEQCRVRP